MSFSLHFLDSNLSILKGKVSKYVKHIFSKSGFILLHQVAVIQLRLPTQTRTLEEG